ncbi:cyclin-dependent kinase 4 isoform X3 [Oncorhynchus mykiss]|uniref:cyclin-dependent kinase 4 isoform X3 n=1 Tax=Oncorhynchus mykiss TaxID=8022 RepID=UPI0018775CBC|nr:cyclin-dependent kinase 4 isoform X3 [Oncorhynchus mykiss]
MEVNGCDEHQNYEILAEIGEGAYGKVYKAREVRDQQRLVAVKKLNIPGHTESGIPAFMIREVALLRKIEYFNHPNIVKLLDVSAGLKNRSLDLTLVFEYIDQDLSTFLTTVPSTGLSLDKIKDVMVQLLQGLDFLHTNMLVHRDLKPENVLVSSRGEVKIADFGLARIYTYHIALTPCVSLQSRTSSFQCTICSIVTVPLSPSLAKVVTLWYRAPEVLLHSGYMSSVDMWSAGCIFAELFLLRPLFRGYTEAQQLQKIFEVIGLPSEEDWPRESPISYSRSWCPRDPCTQLLSNLGQEENNLLLQCLEFSPTNRISASRALSHPFLVCA